MINQSLQNIKSNPKKYFKKSKQGHCKVAFEAKLQEFDLK